MKDFKYCIWYTPKNNHEWHKFTNGCPPHITIYYYLDKDEAIEKIKELQKYNLNIKLIGNLKQTCVDNFYALQYDVLLESNHSKPEWFPDDAHVSFKYQYDNEFTLSEITNLEKKINIKSALFTDFKIVKCSGHYTKWMNI